MLHTTTPTKSGWYWIKRGNHWEMAYLGFASGEARLGVPDISDYWHYEHMNEYTKDEFCWATSSSAWRSRLPNPDLWYGPLICPDNEPPVAATEGSYRDARGAAPAPPGSPLPEEIVRRGRGDGP